MIIQGFGISKSGALLILLALKKHMGEPWLEYTDKLHQSDWLTEAVLDLGSNWPVAVTPQAVSQGNKYPDLPIVIPSCSCLLLHFG